MCPACIASAALIGGSVVSTGGLTAFVVKLVRSNGSKLKSEPTDDSKTVIEESSGKEK